MSAEDIPMYLFPDVALSHAHARDDAGPGQPPDVVILTLHDRDDDRTQLATIVMDPDFARNATTSILREADRAESCMETHPDIRELDR